jgi:hypothetical protein
LVTAIAQLHNFCIDERLLESNRVNQTNLVFNPTNIELATPFHRMRDIAAFFDYEFMELDSEVPWSNNRDRMAKKI